MRLLVCTTAWLIVSALPGCAVTEVKCDQGKIREAVIGLYTDQVIDNLILAANGMPFIQLDYTNATATVTVNANGSVGGNQQVMGTKPQNRAARLAAVAGGLMTSWSYSVSGLNSNQIALTANPAINNNEIYDAYLEFLTLPGSLRVSCDPPPPGVAHICRKWHGQYFWVPVAYRTEFLRLALVTTAQRGRRLLPVPDSYAVLMTAITDSFASDFDKRNGVTELTVKIDKKVPNDTGRVEFDVNGKHVSYLVNQYATGTDVPYMTDQIVVVFSPARSPELKDLDAFKAALPAAAKLYLSHSRPDTPPTTDDLLQSVRFQLEQIRFNQLRAP